MTRTKVKTEAQDYRVGHEEHEALSPGQRRVLRSVARRHKDDYLTWWTDGWLHIRYMRSDGAWKYETYGERGGFLYEDVRD